MWLRWLWWLAGQEKREGYFSHFKTVFEGEGRRGSTLAREEEGREVIPMALQDLRLRVFGQDLRFWVEFSVIEFANFLLFLCLGRSRAATGAQQESEPIAAGHLSAPLLRGFNFDHHHLPTPSVA